MGDLGKLIMELHSNGIGDESPMQMISAERLAYYRSVEVSLHSLLAAINAARAVITTEPKE